MKIRQLHINRFGHFTECGLAFPGNGLQVIYGPNEAGKTTLLEFLRGLLFDFPARTPYDFGGQGEVAGVATLEMQDGRVVELRRRKGNKDKVSIKINGEPSDLEDTGWLRLLDHADRTLFESVFAFGLDQLSQGEESLKHESLQSALFGGSLGGPSSPDKVIAELSRQADELFKKGGSKPTINALLADLKKMTKELRDRSLRPEKYHQVNEDVAKATAHAKALHNQVDALRREHAHVEKLVRAWPKWWELQQRQRERSELGVLQPVPANARQEYLEICKELRTLEAGRAKQATEIAQVEHDLGALLLNPEAVSYRVEIKSCVELRQSFIEARDQLPERRRHRESLQLLIDRELQELRPGWSHDDLRAFFVDVATQAEIDRLSDEKNDRQTSCTKLAAKRDSDFANLDRAREELTAIGEPGDVTALVGVLADEASFLAERKQLESARIELTKLQRKLTTQIRQLTPPLPVETTSPHTLPVPRVETVVEFQSRLVELSEQIRDASKSATDAEDEYQKIEGELAAALKSRVVPSLEERDAARSRRDAGWDLIRRRYIAAEQVDTDIVGWLQGDASATLPDGYARAVRQADGVADQIYENANEVAEREGLRRRLAVIVSRLKERRQHITDLRQQQTELQTEWIALWKPCDFEPLTPEAMRGWLKQHESVCATVEECDELSSKLATLSERITSFEQRLRVACGLTGNDISGMLVSVRQSVESEKDRQRKITELQKEVRRLDKQLAKYDEELEAVQALDAAANSEWRAVLGRLHLPADWDAELARTVIDKLKTTRVRLDSLPGEDARIVAMETRVDEFTRRVRALCEALSPELLRDPAELAVKKLDEQVERAVEAQRKHDDLTKTLAVLRKTLESSGRQVQQAEAKRERLFAVAMVTTDAEFLEVVTQTEKATRLDGEIELLRRDIELIRAGDAPEEFEQALSTSELSMLQGRERDLKEELKVAEGARTKAVGEEALAREALGRMDGSDGAAQLNEELARRRSLLAAEVDRYMPLIFARHLLNSAVSRFEKDNQPEMIATVSRLFGQITGGTYVEFDRSGGGKKNIVVRRSDGVERTPGQLSTGTREQLYLAIRLAYVLYYCERNQPLPIVIDDVLVNFDEKRARQTLKVLADISRSVQILFFTCHPHMVSLAREVVSGLNPIELRGNSLEL